MLKNDQLLWLILLVNVVILFLLLWGNREAYTNFSAKKHYWSDRTGKNMVVNAAESGFEGDLGMMPYQVYGHHAAFGGAPVMEDSVPELDV